VLGAGGQGSQELVSKGVEMRCFRVM
jgi:hypothetical protein